MKRAMFSSSVRAKRAGTSIFLASAPFNTRFPSTAGFKASSMSRIIAVNRSANWLIPVFAFVRAKGSSTFEMNRVRDA